MSISLKSKREHKTVYTLEIPAEDVDMLVYALRLAYDHIAFCESYAPGNTRFNRLREELEAIL